MRRGIAVIALVAAPVLADEVYLRGGGKITGEIVARSADAVTVDIGGGTLAVQMASVTRIEEGTSPLQEYRARAAAIPAGDAEAWRELARWATRRALATQAGEAWTRVVAVLPDDEEANRALGRVRLGGSWVGEEESFRARGFVEFEGEWMTPEERQAILGERRAREESDRQALEAQVRSQEEARRERKAEEEADFEEFIHGGVPQLGDPVLWGWGYPAYWPTTPAPQPLPGRPAAPPAGGRR